jgi:protein phosphatase
MGNLWWGILIQGKSIHRGSTESTKSTQSAESPEIAPENSPDDPSPRSSPENQSEVNSAPTFLDPEQRYQWWPLPLGSEPEDRNPPRQGQVLDCKPLQLNLFTRLGESLQLEMERQMQVEPIDLNHPAVIIAHLQQLGLELSPSPERSISEMPTLAAAYMGLSLQFPYILPALHDTWKQPDRDGFQEVYVVSDRSALPLLRDCWLDESISSVQFLRWLDEMTDLWEAFAPWGCCPSLMDSSNLRVDQGQFLCLQRLIQQPEGIAISASGLGQFWLELFSGTAPCHQQSFASLRQRLELEQITDIPQLQAWLAETAAQMSGVGLSGGDGPSILSEEGGLAYALNSPQGSGGDIPTLILPHQLIQLEVSGQTDTGRDRHHNEDYFLVHHQLQSQITPSGQQMKADGLYILCDGMGGHEQGEVASCLAAETLYQFLEVHWPLPPGQQEALITAGIFAANQALFRKNEHLSRSGSGRMGTTLVLVLVHNTQVWVAHVGDSRLYRVSEKQNLEQITLDHEVGQRDILRGVEPAIAYARPDAYQLTQALGPRDERFVRPQIQSFEIDEDTVLLLCSDGLTDNNLLETHYQSHLQSLLLADSNLDQGTQALIDLANQHNGHDNITVVAVRLRVQSQLSLFF